MFCVSAVLFSLLFIFSSELSRRLMCGMILLPSNKTTAVFVMSLFCLVLSPVKNGNRKNWVPLPCSTPWLTTRKTCPTYTLDGGCVGMFCVSGGAQLASFSRKVAE